MKYYKKWNILRNEILWERKYYEKWNIMRNEISWKLKYFENWNIMRTEILSGQDCVSLRKADGLWDDQVCSKEQQFVCKKAEWEWRTPIGPNPSRNCALIGWDQDVAIIVFCCVFMAEESCCHHHQDVNQSEHSISTDPDQWECSTLPEGGQRSDRGDGGQPGLQLRLRVEVKYFLNIF